MKRSRIPIWRVRSRVSHSQPRSFGINLLKSWLTDSITLPFISDIGNGDPRTGMKTFLRKKCIDEDVAWTTNPRYYVSSALKILEGRERRIESPTEADHSPLHERTQEMRPEPENLVENTSENPEHREREDTSFSALLPMISPRENEELINGCEEGPGTDPGGTAVPDRTHLPHPLIRTLPSGFCVPTDRSSLNLCCESRQEEQQERYGHVFERNGEEERLFQQEVFGPLLPSVSDSMTSPIEINPTSIHAEGAETSRPNGASIEREILPGDLPDEITHPDALSSTEAPPGSVLQPRFLSPSLNCKNIEVLLEEIDEDEVMTNGRASFSKVRLLLRRFCREKGWKWSSNPSFYINHAIQLLHTKHNVEDPSGNATTLGRSLDPVTPPLPSNLPNLVREHIYSLKTTHTFHLLKLPSSELERWVREVGKGICRLHELKQPKTWRHYYQVARNCLHLDRICAFKKSKSLQHMMQKNERKSWRPLSVMQRKKCEFEVRRRLLQSLGGKRCPTLREVLKTWRCRLRKWRRRDSRIFGHCKSLWHALKKLNWNCHNTKVPPSPQPNYTSDTSIMVKSLNIGGGAHNILSSLVQMDSETDIFCFQETWELPGESLSSSAPPGWRAFSVPRASCVEGSRGGGLAVFMKQHVSAKLIPSRLDEPLGTQNEEFMCIKVGRGTKSFILWNIYIPPSSICEAPSLMKRIAESSKRFPIVLVGDFNWNWLRDPPTGRGTVWMDLGKNLSLRMINGDLGPTFSRMGSESLIDHVWISEEMQASHIQTSEMGYEHKLISFQLDGALGRHAHEGIPRVRVRWEKIRNPNAYILRDQWNRSLLRDLKKRNVVNSLDFIAAVRNTSTKVFDVTSQRSRNRFEGDCNRTT
eukprot:TRINITY_DN2224_c0_g1_i1.p1 TRINITY_DN2224_c0_g1~~TRINITY_DN2224_c0_g1_i1.p1  ORF type:complete len:872 (+),score=67.45 TRINITY_DN2224_c0_g1_i1:186-2801(+)